jgi:methylmalonyl-CoA mutase C-terminal domain/subunit
MQMPSNFCRKQQIRINIKERTQPSGVARESLNRRVNDKANIPYSKRPLTLERSMVAVHNYRILIAKPGLDGHDRGAKYVAHVLRDAGFEVIYTGIRRSPEQIVEAAIQEDVAGIGLSLLSGAHNVLFERVMQLLHERHADDIVVFGGGTIPPKDIPLLKNLGVAAIFTPGTPAKQIVETLHELLDEKAAVCV